MNENLQAPNTTGSQRRTRVRGIDRTLQILDCLQNRQCPATTYEVAKDLAAPLSSIYSLVDVLVASRLLERDDNGMIWLGARLYRYGLAYARIHGPLATTATAASKSAPGNIAQGRGEAPGFLCGRGGRQRHKPRRRDFPTDGAG